MTSSFGEAPLKCNAINILRMPIFVLGISEIPIDLNAKKEIRKLGKKI